MLGLDDDTTSEQKAGIFPEFKLAERGVLARLMCRNISCQDTSLQALTETRNEALEALIALCGRCEPRLVEHKKRNSSSPDNDLDSRLPFTVKFTGEHCPWCFYNERYCHETRSRTFSTVSNHRRHVDEMHLARKTYTEAAICPFLECTEILQTETALKVHLERKHTLRTSQKRTCRSKARAVDSLAL